MTQLAIGELVNDLRAAAVIMAGGSGTRFWPLSRAAFPKQFLPLTGTEESLIQTTGSRVEPLVGRSGIMVVTAENQAQLVRKHLPHACVLVEPVPRNTAPCIGYAAIKVLQSAGDIPMVCLPADHVVHGTEEILEVYRRGIEIARAEDVLITIGIKPTHPETGYGYIRRGAPYGRGDVFEAAEFVEKPNIETAGRYLASGNYFWNSGMFIWRPTVILRAIRSLLPELAACLDRLEPLLGLEDAWERAGEIYRSMPAVSIDIGVLEKADKVLMLPGDSFRWSDVGSWSSWAEAMLAQAPHPERNVCRGDVLLLDCNGCTVVGGNKLIAAVGLENLVIIDTDDALLVCPREQSQDVKKIVDKLREAKRLKFL